MSAYSLSNFVVALAAIGGTILIGHELFTNELLGAGIGAVSSAVAWIIFIT